jgi:hypothetical protein
MSTPETLRRSDHADQEANRERAARRAAVWGDRHTRLLTKIAIAALTLATAREIGTNWPEFWVGGAETGAVLSQISYGYLGGWIVNLLVVELPNERRRRQPGPLHDLVMADEAIAEPLRALFVFRGHDALLRKLELLRGHRERLAPLLSLYPWEVTADVEALNRILDSREKLVSGKPRDLLARQAF